MFVCVFVWTLSHQVLWLPSDLRALVQEIDPELQQTAGSPLPLEELQSNHIVKLNLHYSSMSAELTRSETKETKDQLIWDKNCENADFCVSS